MGKRLGIVADLENKLNQMDGATHKATLQRIRDWPQLKNQISSLIGLEGVERFLTIAFEDPFLKPVFDSYVKRMDALKPGMFEEIDIGEHLSSALTAYYPNIIVLRLLDSPEKERLECISRLYAKFAAREAATDK